MLFGLGNRVRFIHTGAEGVIVDKKQNDIYIVELDGGIEIPASGAHMERVDADLSGSSVKGKVVRPEEKPKQELPLPERQYAILKNAGILLAFQPHKRPDGAVQRYTVYLVNDTLYTVTFDFRMNHLGRKLKTESSLVNASSFHLLMEMQGDYLSDNPEVEIRCRQITTERQENWLSKKFKVKPKQFFTKHKRSAPLLDKEAYVYPLFKPLEVKEQKGSLEQYTKQKIQKQAPLEPIRREGDYVEWTGADVKAFAEFPLEKDFHIENLVPDIRKVRDGDILRIQLEAFDKYIKEAVRLGIPKVFVIHGKGKGRLRDEIATRLVRHRNVATFKNEYHPKYGTGATEVVFK